MVPIPAGKFQMGSALHTNPDEPKQFKLLTSGDFDEKPVHEPHGNRKHQSSWRDSKCTGTACYFDLSGQVTKTYKLVDGFLKP